jgi:hypothetical protein
MPKTKFHYIHFMPWFANHQKMKICILPNTVVIAPLGGRMILALQIEARLNRRMNKLYFGFGGGEVVHIYMCACVCWEFLVEGKKKKGINTL